MITSPAFLAVASATLQMQPTGTQSGQEELVRAVIGKGQRMRKRDRLSGHGGGGGAWLERPPPFLRSPLASAERMLDSSRQWMLVDINSAALVSYHSSLLSM